MEARGILITGTDTGVGKTFVACGIAAALRRRSWRVGPFKPSETGCEWDTQTHMLVPSDAMLLREASQTSAPIETICPYRFRTPVAPSVAARLEGGVIDPEHLIRCYSTLAASHDVVLVESAGGILVPLAPGFHYGDLARRLDLPVLVVAGSKLGMINHTLLTLSYLESSGCTVLGCVVNHCSSEQSPAIATNVEALLELAPQPIFVMPNFPNARRAREGWEFDEMAARLFGAPS